ncbi:hypothetical protein KY284_032697 [Solanum tuberosum]|nr:hypothetical protein KY284_032697 [Solanum tuberosum]
MLNNNSLPHPMGKGNISHHPTPLPFFHYQPPFQPPEMPTYSSRNPAFQNLTNPLTPFDQNYMTSNPHLLETYPHAVQVTQYGNWEGRLDLPHHQNNPTPLPTMIEERLTSSLISNFESSSLQQILDMYVSNQPNKEHTSNEEDENMEDRVVPEMTMREPSSSTMPQTLREELIFDRSPLRSQQHNYEHEMLQLTDLNEICDINHPNNKGQTTLGHGEHDQHITNETRMEDHNGIPEVVEYTDVIQVPATGYSGEIALFWRNTKITIEPFVMTEQEIHATIEFMPKTIIN